MEVLSDGGSQPATKKQKAYIQRLLRAFPDARELLEYEDYLKNQTQESASEFIRQAREDFAVPMSQRENYLDYVSHRPGVELRGEHGLWTSGGKVENLSEAVREVAEHRAHVWTPAFATSPKATRSIRITCGGTPPSMKKRRASISTWWSSPPIPKRATSLRTASGR